MKVVVLMNIFHLMPIESICHTCCLMPNEKSISVVVLLSPYKSLIYIPNAKNALFKNTVGVSRTSQIK